MATTTKEQMLKDFDEDTRKLRECLVEGPDDPKDMGYSLVAVGPNRTGALFNTNNMLLILGALTVELHRQSSAFEMQRMLDAAKDMLLTKQAEKTTA